MRNLTRSDVTFTLHCEPEEMQIEGNASAIGPKEDAETYAWIRDQLDRGNDWAWCCAHVRAHWLS